MPDSASLKDPASQPSLPSQPSPPPLTPVPGRRPGVGARLLGTLLETALWCAFGVVGCLAALVLLLQLIAGVVLASALSAVKRAWRP